MRRRLTVVALGVAALAAIAFEAADYQRGAALVIDAGRLDGWAGPIAQVNERRYRVSPAPVTSRHGRLTSRLYVPEGSVHRAVLLVPGVHAAGIDEPRLVGFAGDLAQRGMSVLTVELPDLQQYSITPQTTDMIEDAALWLSAQREVAPDGRIGVAGISFGGGLTIVAAGRPSLAGKIAFALSFGGHGDFARTLRFLCTGRLDGGGFLAPHDYGVVIILLGVAPRLVPADQVETLRHGIRTFLQASHVDMVDKARAAAIFRQARDLGARMPEPAATYMRYVNARDVRTLGPLLHPHVGAIAEDRALSAERSPAPDAPVYLLHGADDNVIPAVESERLAAYLRPHTDVKLLLTPLITHAEVDRPPNFGEIWKLVSFWTAMLDE